MSSIRLASRRTLFTTLALASFAAGTATAADLRTHGLRSLDRDADGIADALDNCPLQANGEQRDTDRDGVGNACDLTLVMAGDGWTRLSAGGLHTDAIAVAEVYNFTDEVQPYTVSTDSDSVYAMDEEGLVEPGEIKTVYVGVDALGLSGVLPGDAEAEMRAQVTVEVPDDAGLVDVGAAIFPAAAATCSYNIKRDNIKVTKGEGGADPALELIVDTTVFYGVGNDATVSWSGSLSKNSSHTTDATIYGTSVTAGTVVNHDWQVDVIEEDTWDADDYDSDAGSFSFTCSGHSTAYDTALLYGLGNAMAEVKLKAVW